MIPDDRFDLCSASYYGMQGLPDFESYAQYYLLQVRKKKEFEVSGFRHIQNLFTSQTRFY